MKKQLLLIGLLALSFGTFAQENNKKLTVFKFYPFNLITSSLGLGLESFNAEQNRSTQFTFGVRYRNADATNNNYYGSGSITNYSKWKGFNVGIERKIFVPTFKTRSKNGVEKGRYGVYLAPFLRADYNQNDFDNSYYNPVVDPKQTNTYINEKVTYAGDATYIGIMPGVNIGFEFTLFQNLYIDAYLGGALRMLSKTENLKTGSNTTSGGCCYYYSSSVIDNWVKKEGVIPNIGLSVGVKW